MLQAVPQFLEVGDTGSNIRRIATLRQAGTAPGIIWLPGFKSDMASTKATALGNWAARRGVAYTRFDYSGHGASDGLFTGGTIGRWLEETAAVFEQVTTGPQIVVGSSMGGYLALLLLRQLQRTVVADLARLVGLVLIAPAWDMTEELMWKQFPANTKATLQQTGVWLRPSQYGEPYPITQQLIDEGRHHLLARVPFDPGRPVHIMHGLRDPDVPWQHTLDLAGFLTGDWTRIAAIPDGEHRLSRPSDLEQLFEMLDSLIRRIQR
jgi:pimeloyl-ACP methyl ester carboxylesterase